MTYVTRQQSMNMKKMVVTSILTTSDGVTLSNASISRHVRLSETTIRRMRKVMKEIGLLGSAHTVTDIIIPEVPDATFDDLSFRLLVIHEFIVVHLPDDNPHAPLKYLEGEWKQINALLKTKGFLSDERGFAMLTERLVRLEDDIEYYCEATTAAYEN